MCSGIKLRSVSAIYSRLQPILQRSRQNDPGGLEEKGAKVTVMAFKAQRARNVLRLLRDALAVGFPVQSRLRRLDLLQPFVMRCTHHSATSQGNWPTEEQRHPPDAEPAPPTEGNGIR